jgi:hypothetical protein
MIGAKLSNFVFFSMRDWRPSSSSQANSLSVCSLSNGAMVERDKKNVARTLTICPTSRVSFAGIGGRSITFSCIEV